MKTIASCIILLCLLGGNAQAQQIVVQPYIQDAEPTSVWILWETDNNDQSLVDWGGTPALLQQSSGGAITTTGNARVHEVKLDSLLPDAVYYYRVVTGTAASDTFHFRTPPLPIQEKAFNIVAASDMQIDNGNPTIWNQIVQNGIIDYVTTHYGGDLPDNLAFAMIPGDLVDNGLNYSEWQNDFFTPAHPLFAQVPVYPVLGNHEINTGYYFDYFHLPDNGSSGFEEHWWYKDYSNLRMIGLDSNFPFDNQTQLDWLKVVLDSACADPNIDFVFAQLHHPHKSELWPPGESNYTGDVIQLMEDFSTNCGKPSIHFFGHTHGYSRGQSRDHSHLWVNVASGGGNIDFWGEYAQIDYAEFTRSDDEYGFVVVEVEAGAEPKFTLKRLSRGDPSNTLQNLLRDSITVTKNNTAPFKPSALAPLNQHFSPDCILLQGSPYDESEGHQHMASHWQISTDCQDFSSPLYDSWKQHENWYLEQDRQAGDDLTNEKVPSIPANSNLCWRVRYRDHSLGWSEWSDPASFSTGNSTLTANLLNNPGAENDTSGWTLTQGFLESLEAGECNGTNPYQGLRYFAAGALCNESAYGEAYQQVDLSSYAAAIDSGDAFAQFGGYLSDWNGNDIPSIWLEFRDVFGMPLDTTLKISHSGSGWTHYENINSMPVGTRSLRFYISGERNSGSDNDSYLDELSLRINPNGCNSIITYSEPPHHDQIEVEVAPNPFLEYTQIHVHDHEFAPWDLVIYDLSGKKVGEEKGIEANEIVFQRRGLPPGMYLLEVRMNGEREVVKLLLE